MGCTPFAVVNVCMLAQGGQYNGRCAGFASLLSIAEVSKAEYEIGACGPGPDAPAH